MNDVLRIYLYVGLSLAVLLTVSLVALKRWEPDEHDLLLFQIDANGLTPVSLMALIVFGWPLVMMRMDHWRRM